MTYKTILVHMNNPDRAERLLEPAIHLASRFNAHLIALHVYPGLPPAPIIAVPYGAEVIGAAIAAEREDAEKLSAIFQRMTAGQPFVAEWRSVKVLQSDLASVVMEHARACDLVIASQADPRWDLSTILDFPERLAIESGRPVLVIPYVGRYATLGTRVTIAWKSSREAARAVFDALPLLTEAETVQILGVEPASADPTGSMLPDTSIAASLARHGVKLTARRSVTGADMTVADEILSRLADDSSDLLVMGAYGHSRIREFVFGGVTRHIARHMTAPTLFSH